MPRTCTICGHPQRAAIDAALVAGEPFRRVAARYGVTEQATRRHRKAHLPAALTKAQEAENAARADDLRALTAEAHRIKDRAERTGDYRTALAGIRELVRIVELLAKLRGELDERPQVNLPVAPEWLAVRAALMAALAAYPEAKAAVAEQLLALDPVRLAERCGITPDPWQGRLLRSQARQAILLCSRQSGKSTVAAVLAVHTALYEPGALVLLLSPSLRQSQEVFRKALGIYADVGRPVPAEAETRLSLELETGSRIVSLPGRETTIRGFSGVHLLVVDEAARVPDELYQAVRPMLAVSGGRIV